MCDWEGFETKCNRRVLLDLPVVMHAIWQLLYLCVLRVKACEGLTSVGAEGREERT